MCSYLLVTNADNLYSRHFMSNLNSDMQREVDMLGVWFISHYTGRAIQLEFDTGKCDLGAVVYRASILRAHPEIRFCTAVRLARLCLSMLSWSVCSLISGIEKRTCTSFTTATLRQRPCVLQMAIWQPPTPSCIPTIHVSSHACCSCTNKREPFVILYSKL